MRRENTNVGKKLLAGRGGQQKGRGGVGGMINKNRENAARKTAFVWRFKEPSF